MEKYEIEFLRALRSISNSFTDFLMEAITFLGEQTVVVAVLIIIFFLYDKKFGRKVAYILITSMGLNGLIKGLVQRIRPFHYDHTLDSVRIETATGYSFPSGHTQNSSTILYTLSIHFKKKLIWIICVVLSILIGFSRLALGVHYPTDVIVGLGLGIGCSFLLTYLFDKFAKTFKGELILYLCTFVIFIPFLFVFYKSDYSLILPFKGYYQIIALFLGFIGGFVIESKYVNFSNNVPLKTKIIRILGAVIVYVIINMGLKLVFPKENIFFVFIRYFLTSFCILGIYPLIFKKILFKKED